MPLVVQNARRDGHSGLSTSVTVGICIALSAAALTLGEFSVLHSPSEILVTDRLCLTLGALGWIFIVRRRNKGTAHTSTSTKSQSSSATLARKIQKPEPTNPVDLGRAQGLSPTLLPPPAYSPGMTKSSSPSNKKSTPPLNVEVDFDIEPTLHSPLRSASFNPSPKTQSIGSRISSRMSGGAKNLYVNPSGFWCD